MCKFKFILFYCTIKLYYNSIINKHEKNNFIHFGCRASKDEDTKITNDKYGFDGVMNLVHTNSENVDFCIVSGDNYYANRKTKAIDAKNEAERKATVASEEEEAKKDF